MGSLPAGLEEIQDLILKALKVIIDRQMPESEARKLVEWVKAGNNPEDYGQKPEVALPDDTNDPHSSYWKALPPNVKVTRAKRGYELHASLAHNEGVPVVYGMMSNLEYLKGISKEPEDLQFPKALPGVMEIGKKARIAAREEAAKKDAEHQATLQAKAQAKAQKAEAARAKREKSVSKNPSTGSGQASSTGSIDSPQADSGQTGEALANNRHQVLTRVANKPSKGILEKLAQMIGNKTGMDGKGLVQAGETMVLKAGKQTLGWELRKFMRKFVGFIIGLWA